MKLYTILIYFMENYMNEINYKAYAKINITLDVIGKRADGYHDLEMIMQNVDLYDEITVSKREDDKIVLFSGREDLPSDRGNIAYRAAEYMIEKFSLKTGVNININKNIPVAAGLAGGSTDCAAVLKAVNELYSLGLDSTELRKHGKTLGADVPYCIEGKTALVEGIGDKLTFLGNFPKMNVVLAKADIDVSTAFVYKNFKAENVEKRPETEKVISAIKNNDQKAICDGLCNVLESVTIPAHPIIKEIKEKLIYFGAENALMSGSGPTVFAFFKDKETSDKAAEEIKKIFEIKEVYSTTTI